MNFDRGFVKWQPFNSVVSNKTILNNLNNAEKVIKPTLFPEEIEKLNEQLIEAYYSHNLIEITIYEENKIKKYKTTINKIDSNTKTIYLKNHKIIYFNEIIHIKTI